MEQKESNTIRISISLDPLRDHDLLVWLSEQGNKSESVRALIRDHLKEQPNIADEVFGLKKQMEELLAAIRYGQVNMSVPELAQAPTKTTEHDSEGEGDAGDNLDKMIGRWTGES